MGRMTFVLRRLLQLVPVAIGCTIVVFFMIHLIPGDPAQTIMGIHATPKAVALLHQEWGLNRPLISQYWLFMDPLIGLGMPQFWLAFLLIYAFAIKFLFFPLSGCGTVFFGHLRSMFLPS